MSDKTTDSHAAYHSARMERIVRLCRQVGEFGDRLAKLHSLHREISIRLTQGEKSSLDVSEIVVLRVSSLPADSDRVIIDTALLRSVIEMDMVRRLVMVLEASEQIPAALDNLPSVKEAMDSEKNNESS